MEILMIFSRFGKWMVVCVGLLPLLTANSYPVFADETKVAVSADTVEMEEEKRDFVRHMAQDALSILHDPKKSFSNRKETLENAFITVVDIQWIARFVLGRNWNNATEEQQQRYTSLYRKYLTKAYISTFNEDPKRKIRDIRIISVSDTENEKFSVRTELHLVSKEVVKVDYVVRDKDNRYKVIDIAIQGVSLLNSHREQFTDIASAKGVEAVIGELEQMIGQTKYAMAAQLQ
jgi:phospholipid transport system substrate-binding protein